jgi:hypothetical protein
MAMVSFNAVATIFSLCFIRKASSLSSITLGTVSSPSSLPHSSLVISSFTLDRSSRFKSIRFLVVAIPQLTTLLIFSCVLFLYSFRLISLLMQSHGTSSGTSATDHHLSLQQQSDVEVKMKLITRITVVTFVCIFCYLLRIGVYLWAAYTVLILDSDKNSHYILHPLWYLLTDWIPTAGPVSALTSLFLSFTLCLSVSVSLCLSLSLSLSVSVSLCLCLSVLVLIYSPPHRD